MIAAQCPSCQWQSSAEVPEGTTIFCEECGIDFRAEPTWMRTVTMDRPIITPKEISPQAEAVLALAACPTPLAAVATGTAELMRANAAANEGPTSFPLELSFTFNYILLAGARGTCKYTLRNTSAQTVGRIRLVLESDALEGGSITVSHDPLGPGLTDDDSLDLGQLSKAVHGQTILKCTLEAGTQEGIRTAEGKLPGVTILPPTASPQDIRVQIGDNFGLGAEGLNLNLGGQGTDRDLLQMCMDDAPARSVMLKVRSSIFVEDLPHHFINSLHMEMVRVPVGTKNAWFCHHQVTQLHWYQVMGTTQEQQLAKKGSRHCGLDPRMPVYGVSLPEAREFCEKLNLHQQSNGSLPPGYHYRLPTEAEWRAASGPANYSDRELQHHAWTMLAKVEGPQLVGCLRPNEFGLYDMRGNVFEWCDEKEMPATEKAAVFGGSWYADPQGTDLEAARQGSRILCPITTRSSRIGLRLVLAPRL
jgi:Sulfatase-modifying factor enzyme 1